MDAFEELFRYDSRLARAIEPSRESLSQKIRDQLFEQTGMIGKDTLIYRQPMLDSLVDETGNAIRDAGEKVTGGRTYDDSQIWKVLYCALEQEELPVNLVTPAARRTRGLFIPNKKGWRSRQEHDLTFVAFSMLETPLAGTTLTPFVPYLVGYAQSASLGGVVRYDIIPFAQRVGEALEKRGKHIEAETRLGTSVFVPYKNGVSAKHSVRKFAR